ncbi:MAG: UDP-N-acetylmuramate dehydrogenase [Pseudanabaena sp. ELA607]
MTASITDLSSLPTLIRSNVSLASFTTMKAGGCAQWFSNPRTIAELQQVLLWANSNHQPITMIGAGSNLLISDQGLPGLIICTRQLRGITYDAVARTVTAAAGEPLARLAWQVADHGWSGFEWAVGIPGTVGGLVVMNAGAQGGCAADQLQSVQALTYQGESVNLYPQDLDFAYRTSNLQKDDCQLIVVGATFQFPTGQDPLMIRQDTDHKLKQRHSTQPYHLANCGSVFRNPYPQAAGKLIEECGLKGYRIGNAEVSPMHANFIINTGNAKSSDILRLIRYIQATVQTKFGITLEPEVKMLGSFADVT